MSNVYDNLVTTVPTRFSVIQPSLLGPMQVLESISTEDIITARMKQLVTIWASHDPPNAAQYDVGNLEFDPIRINQELNAYFELLVRDRVNQAARSVTLAYAVGSDLDAIGSRYPYGVTRLPGETDDAYRTRLWLSPSILSLSGPGQATFESYVFWAMSAPMPAGEATIKCAAAFTTPGTGNVYIPIMSAAMTTTRLFPKATTPKASAMMVASPRPTANQISAVYQYITESGTARKGLTDVINVITPKITDVALDIQVWLFPGVDKATLMGEIDEALAGLIQALRWLGADLTMLSLQGALAQAGVYNTKIVSPAADVLVDTAGVINVTSVNVTYKGTGE